MVSSDFLSLMACADVMVGNSSAAIREAPSYHLPSVNIGTRQQGRLRAENVIDVDHNENKIISAIKKALNDKAFISKTNQITNPYGDGKSAKRIVDILEQIPLNSDLVQKRITYEL
jgi:UDP-N-acetylglucosamine 2-epimerase (non-hydrolysing)/GDP/UDP-N,N'-diacetylbacillosamine 2-epimerase (hydrolysing)